MFEFKSQNWFDIFLELIEFPTNFRGLNYLNLIQTNGLKKGKVHCALGPLLATGFQPIQTSRPSNTGLLAHFSEAGDPGHGGISRCPSRIRPTGGARQSRSRAGSTTVMS
jgi:hypothetical protein